MGTGHFTRWLAEVSEPGTEIYAFDFSWPIIDRTKANAGGLPGVVLFTANARGCLPFRDEFFDIVLLRLAPLGPHGVPNVQAGYDLLKPGGWYFEAGWKRERVETKWAIQNGFAYAEHHAWQYRRTQTEEEAVAEQTELKHLLSMGGGDRSPGQAGDTSPDTECHQGGGERVLRMTWENVLIARKPA